MSALQDGVDASSTCTSHHYDSQNTDGSVQRDSDSDDSHTDCDYRRLSDETIALTALFVLQFGLRSGSLHWIFRSARVRRRDVSPRPERLLWSGTDRLEDAISHRRHVSTVSTVLAAYGRCNSRQTLLTIRDRGESGAMNRRKCGRMVRALMKSTRESGRRGVPDRDRT